VSVHDQRPPRFFLLVVAGAFAVLLEPAVATAVAEPPLPPVPGPLVTVDPDGEPICVMPVFADVPVVPTTVTDVPVTRLTFLAFVAACDAAVAVPAPAASTKTVTTALLRRDAPMITPQNAVFNAM